MKFTVIGIFQYEEFSMQVPFPNEISGDQREIESIDFGCILFNPETKQFIHKTEQGSNIIENYNTIVYELLEPRENVNHKEWGGIPLYEKEDFKIVSFLEFTQLLSRYCNDNNKKFLSFNNIAYEVKGNKKECS